LAPATGAEGLGCGCAAVGAGVGFVCALGGGFGGALAGWGGGVACGFGEEQAVTVAKTISAEHRIAHRTLKCAAIRPMRTSQPNSKEWPTATPAHRAIYRAWCITDSLATSLADLEAHRQREKRSTPAPPAPIRSCVVRSAEATLSVPKANSLRGALPLRAGFDQNAHMTGKSLHPTTQFARLRLPKQPGYWISLVQGSASPVWSRSATSICLAACANCPVTCRIGA
jgi:hypothetical protein